MSHSKSHYFVQCDAKSDHTSNHGDLMATERFTHFLENRHYKFPEWVFNINVNGLCFGHMVLYSYCVIMLHYCTYIWLDTRAGGGECFRVSSCRFLSNMQVNCTVSSTTGGGVAPAGGQMTLLDDHQLFGEPTCINLKNVYSN